MANTGPNDVSVSFGPFVTHMWLPVHPQHNSTNNHDNHKNRTKNINNSSTTITSNPGTTMNDLIIAQGEFFFSLCFLKTLNNIDSYSGHIEATEGLGEGSSEENGAKQCQMRHLGHSASFFFLIMFFIC